jgi:hypothetical protein
MSTQAATKANQLRSQRRRKQIYEAYVRLGMSQLDASLELNVSLTMLKKAIKENRNTAFIMSTISPP